MGSRSGARASSSRHEDARDRQLDIAVEEAQHAVHLVLLLDTERGDEPLARVLAEVGAGIGEPTRTRRTVDTIETGEVVDRQLVEDVLTQQVALANLECTECFADRLLQLTGVLRTEVLALRARR